MLTFPLFHCRAIVFQVELCSLQASRAGDVCDAVFDLATLPSDGSLASHIFVTVRLQNRIRNTVVFYQACFFAKKAWQKLQSHLVSSADGQWTSGFRFPC